MTDPRAGFRSVSDTDVVEFHVWQADELTIALAIAQLSLSLTWQLESI